MKVILTKEVLGLGDPGEIVQVKDGYARNYLVPQKLAIVATKNNMAQVEAERKRIAAAQAKEAEQMSSLAGRLRSLPLQLEVRAGEGGRLYGSVTNQDVVKSLAALGYEIDRRRIIMEPIKKLGDHTIKIKLHPQVTAELQIKIKTAEIASPQEEAEQDGARIPDIDRIPAEA
ncbi:MAG: 50S ribosomal protein L9 [Desulfarculales bacterium]|jgi:large subunit ribosomal protein L9|nr:50S ribosomal protein L9 [Desulfarculales bacterium]